MEINFVCFDFQNVSISRRSREDEALAYRPAIVNPVHLTSGLLFLLLSSENYVSDVT